MFKAHLAKMLMTVLATSVFCIVAQSESTHEGDDQADIESMSVEKKAKLKSEMAVMHQNMADCLKSEKTIKECRTANREISKEIKKHKCNHMGKHKGKHKCDHEEGKHESH